MPGYNWYHNINVVELIGHKNSASIRNNAVELNQYINKLSINNLLN